MEEIGFLVHRLHHQMKQIANANMAKMDLTFVQVHLLACLDENGGVLSQKQIEHEMKLSHSTVVGLIERLKNNGYVEYWNSPEDRRIKMVGTTEKAKALHAQLDENRNETEEMVYGVFSEKEKEELSAMLKKAIKRTDELRGDENV